MGSPSHGGDVVAYVFDINQLSLPTPFYSILVSVSVFMALSADCNLNMTQHVLNICRSANIELRQIGSIRHLLTAQATQTLVCAFILSRLDYCDCCLLAVHSSSLTECRKFRTQRHDLSVGQKNLTMSNLFSSRYTGF